MPRKSPSAVIANRRRRRGQDCGWRSRRRIPCRSRTRRRRQSIAEPIELGARYIDFDRSTTPAATSHCVPMIATRRRSPGAEAAIVAERHHVRIEPMAQKLVRNTIAPSTRPMSSPVRPMGSAIVAQAMTVSRTFLALDDRDSAQLAICYPPSSMRNKSGAIGFTAGPTGPMLNRQPSTTAMSFPLRGPHS